MKNTKKLFIIAIVALLAFALIACDKTTQDNDNMNSVSNDDQDNDASNDGYLKIAVSSDSKTWDPTTNNALDGGQLIYQLFEGLVRETEEGPVKYTGATDIITEDNKTWTFKLREDAVWSDGKPVTAHDYVYAWIRGADPEVASEYSHLITNYVVGAQEFYDGTGSADDIAVKAVDDYTFEVELLFPVSYFKDLLVQYVYFPVRKDIVEANGDGWEKSPETCISNGPFVLEEYKPNEKIVMKKNETYHSASNVKLLGIEFVIIGDGTTAMNAFNAGEVHINTNVPPSKIPELIATDSNFALAPRAGTYFLAFNVDQAPFDNVDVRKAFQKAIDKDDIVTNVTKAQQVPAKTFVYHEIPFSDGSTFDTVDTGLSTGALVEEAKAHLESAGYPNGEGLPEIIYYYNTNDGHKAVAEALQQQWKEVLGVEVKIMNEEWQVFQSRRTDGNFQIARHGWIGDYMEPSTMLDIMANDSGSNDTQWRDIEFKEDKTLNPEAKKFNDLIEKARELSPGPEQDELYKQAELELTNVHAVVAPIYYYNAPRLVNREVVENDELSLFGIWYFADTELVQ